MEISSEVLVAALSIVGSALGVWGVRSKGRAAAALTAAEAQLVEANTELEKVKAAEGQTTQLLKLFEHQVTINQQNQEASVRRDTTWQDERKAWGERLEAANQTAERNYQTFRRVSDENARYLGGLIEASNKNTDAILEKLTESVDKLPERISDRTRADINPAITEGVKAGILEFARTLEGGFATIGDRLANTLASTLGDRFDKALMKRDITFPPPNDGRWVEMIVSPNVHYRPVHFYTQPAYGDNTHTPIELIEPMIGRVVPHVVADWHAVSINPYAFGFIPAAKVNCDRVPDEHPPVPESVRATGNYPVIAN